MSDMQGKIIWVELTKTCCQVANLIAVRAVGLVHQSHSLVGTSVSSRGVPRRRGASSPHGN